MVFATLGLTIPVIVTSLLLILIFAVWLNWLPSSGWGKPNSWILPFAAYATIPMATYARYTRSAMLDVLNKPFVTALRTKGLSERRIIFQHVLRNAALPMVTVFLPMFIGTATGSIFVKATFRIPGLGAYFVTSIELAVLLGVLTRGGFFTIVLIAALFGWVQVCLLVRAQVKAFREKVFVRAARAMGASPWFIIRRHLIPNSISPIIVGFVLAIPLAMMLEASLSFLGIGVPPPTPSWGQMINTGMNFMYFYRHMAVFPTAALATTVLAATLFGDGLRNALDPTLKGR